MIAQGSIIRPAANCSQKKELNGEHTAMMYTETCKDILVRFPEWLAEMLRRSAFLGLTAEHVEGDSCNLAGMFLHNSVDVPNFAAKFEPNERRASRTAPD